LSGPVTNLRLKVRIYSFALGMAISPPLLVNITIFIEKSAFVESYIHEESIGKGRNPRIIQKKPSYASVH
jgi:hypothetical protein